MNWHRRIPHLIRTSSAGIWNEVPILLLRESPSSIRKRSLSTDLEELSLQDQDLHEYSKFYDDLPPPVPGSALAVIAFQDMAVNDLAGLALVVGQTRVQNFENNILYVWSQYHIFLKTKMLRNLVLAIKQLEMSLSAIDSSSLQYEWGLRALVVLLSKKFSSTVDLPDLEAAVFQAQVLLSMTDRLDPERYSKFLGLMLLFGKYAALTGNQSPLDELVEGARIVGTEAVMCLQTTPNEEIYKPGDKSILMEKLKDGIADMPPTVEARNLLLDNLATLTFMHWKHHDQDQAALEEAIKTGEMAIPAAPDVERTALRLMAVSTCLALKYEEYSHNLDDLQSAISKIEQAIMIGSETSSSHYLKLLHDFLTLRFRNTHCIDDIERAAQILEGLLVELEPGDDKIPLWQDLLSIDLSELFEARKNPEALDLVDKAIQLNSEVLAYIDKHPDEEPVTRWLCNYANRLGLRYEHKNAVEDLELADRLLERAVSHPYDERKDRPRYLSSYAVHLLKKYSYFGQMDDLDQAIRRGNEALSQASSFFNDVGYFPEKSQVLHTVEAALIKKFDATGDLDLLKEAVKRGEEAVEYLLPLDSLAPLYLNNLAGDYLRLYERLGNTDDLFKGLRRQEEALEKAPLGNKDRPLLSIRMAQLLCMRYHYDTNAHHSDLDRAISLVRESIDATSSDDWQRPGRIVMLGQNLYLKWQESGDPDILNEAISLGREGVRLGKNQNPSTAEEMHFLARAFFERHILSGNINEDDDLREAIRIAKEGLCHTFSSTQNRIRCGILAAEFYRQAHKITESADIAEQTVRLLPSVSSRALKQADQQHMLKESAGLTTTAVASAFAADRSSSHCLELLEFGRGIINGLRFDSRVDMTLLESKDANLAQEFVSLKNQLEQQDSGTGPADLSEIWAGEFGAEISRSHKHDVTRKFQEKLLQIQKMAGLETFLASPQAEDLKQASKSPQEAIVVINVSFRCDAMIVQNGEIAHLHLPDLHKDDIERSVKEMRYIRLGTGATAQDCRKISLILGWLWVSLVRPVLNELGFTKVPPGKDWPRVWWIPTGALCQLPLHAAGYHSAGMSESALDRVLSSYSSSIKALLYTRRNRMRRDPKEPGNLILLASVQNADDQNLLEHAEDEVEALAKVLPGDLKPILLSEPDKQDILSRLPSCAVFHFAGHGMSDPLDPSESCLLVKDWNKTPASALSVKDLIGLNLYVQSPWLAYLSACSTGETKDDRLYDESIHLMSGCQLAGFQHVVGSLWEISDRYSVDVAREVYTVIKSEIGTLG